ncbi:hypothetical protein PTSG_00065 [Salpingoeca rosetta]|uniref:Calpain catalytic domain-containing protein n=1 Tax=Salpingoeca rosetta (strain ATCC 50818 / BSB-021) TaxID=946362 RepID=F2TVF3_SALR5|nr:uncharacterized protein PTSG_00065 [Salpingoeca rosetta]EGD72049.1 hypothetical protein PTSG_00065 [Salpingoeca rosetta]|eukprot:XP_004998621.1 hypothetical protein PTSG_00065 [Salpingoeca rosetta]
MAEKRELAEGVFVLQERLEDPTRIRYEILNETDATLDMTINLEGSENVSFREGKLEICVTVEPKSQRYAGTMFVTDPRKGWKLACKFNWTATRQVPAGSAPKSVRGDNDSNTTPDADNGAGGPKLPDVTVAPQRPADEDRRPDPHIHPREIDIPYPEDQRRKKDVSTPRSPRDDAAAPNVHRKPLEEGVTLVRTQYQNPTKFDFEVENTLCEALEFTLSIEGSANIAFADGSLVATKTVEPENTTFIGQCSISNPKAAWSLNSKFSWKRVPPSREYQQKKIREQQQRIADELEAYRKTPLFDGDDRLSLGELITECKKYSVKFIDTEFLPAESQIFTEDSEYRDPDTPIVWRRASEFFAGKDYDVFVKGVEPADIKQGRLGDCWLMCALASIAEREERILKIFQSPRSTATQTRNAVGAYQVRLCKNGEWWLIRLDDYFPCLPGQGPVFSRSHGNELWVLLLEKAFAKICGCYDMLRGGLACEALMDITGCPTRDFKMDETGTEDLWEMLKAEDERDNIMTCSVPGEDKWSNVAGRDLGGPGLVSGAAWWR